MGNVTNIPSATAESFWAALQALTERQAKTDLQMAETNRQMAETDRQISRLEKQIGGVTNNHGLFAEEFFINSLEEGEKTLLGEKFDKLIKTKIVEDENNRTKGEFDIVLVNGKSVAIVEVKFRARDKHVDKVLKKVKPFRDRFPEYQNHQLYLGMASMIFDDVIETKCKEKGIAVIKQVGDTIVILDKNLKSFYFF
jgi:Holliday junction resolvase-like predicted endonuclease